MLPFRGECSGGNAILERPPVSPLRLNPDLPPKLEEIINKALVAVRSLPSDSVVTPSETGMVGVADSARILWGHAALTVVDRLEIVQAEPVGELEHQSCHSCCHV